MDSLEPELNTLYVKGGVLGTINEYSVEGEFEDANLNDFHEFDVSWREFLWKWSRWLCAML